MDLKNSKWANIASLLNQNTFQTKPWRMRRRRDDRLREIAGKAVGNDLLVGTARDMAERFGPLFTDGRDDSSCVHGHNPEDVFYWVVEIADTRADGKFSLAIVPLALMDKE